MQVQDANGVSDFVALRASIERTPHRLVLFAFDSAGYHWCSDQRRRQREL
jgi:hypothetical protein